MQPFLPADASNCRSAFFPRSLPWVSSDPIARSAQQAPGQVELPAQDERELLEAVPRERRVGAFRPAQLYRAAGNSSSIRGNVAGSRKKVRVMSDSRHTASKIWRTPYRYT